MKKKQFLKTTFLALVLTLGGASTALADDYQEWPLVGTPTTYLDMSKCTNLSIGSGTPRVTADGSAEGGYKIDWIPASSPATAYAEFNVHNSTENYYIIKFFLSYANTSGNEAKVTVKVTDVATSTVELNQTLTFNSGNDNKTGYLFKPITEGNKVLRFEFNNNSGGCNFKNVTFQAFNPATEFDALPLESSSESATYLDLSTYSAKHSNIQYYNTNDGEIGSVKNGYYIEYYINNENASANYALRMGVNKHNNGTMTVTVTDATTNAEEATGTFTISEGSNYANYIFNLTGSITPGIKKIRFDFAIGSSDYILNFNHVTFFKTDIPVSAAGAATLVLPFDVTIPDGVEAYTLNFKSGNAAAKATAVETTISKDTPVLLNAAKGTYTFVPASDVQAESTNTTPTNGALHGTYAGTTLTSSDNAYVLQNGGEGLGFYQVGSTNINVGAYKAYLVAQGEAHVLTIDFGNGDVTSIREIANSQKPLANSQYYDLQGRKVAQPTRGLYIVNGKKVVIK